MDETPYETVGVPPVSPPPSTNYPPTTSSGLSENSAAALCYLTFIPAIIFLVIEPYNKSVFVRFHAFQCIAFSVVAFAAHMVLIFIPIIGWLISLLLTVVFFVVWLMAILKASKGEWYKIPFIGDFALKQAQS